MAVDEVKTRLAAMQRNITGVNKVFDHYPRALTGALPAFTTRSGPATYDMQSFGEGILAEQRVYYMQLWVREIGTGTEYAAEDDTEPYIDLVKAYFAARPGLELTSASLSRGIDFDAELLGDNGVEVREYAGNRYAMVEFRIRVTDLMAIQYTDG